MPIIAQCIQTKHQPKTTLQSKAPWLQGPHDGYGAEQKLQPRKEPPTIKENLLNLMVHGLRMEYIPSRANIVQFCSRGNIVNSMLELFGKVNGNLQQVEKGFNQFPLKKHTSIVVDMQ